MRIRASHVYYATQVARQPGYITYMTDPSNDTYNVHGSETQTIGDADEITYLRDVSHIPYILTGYIEDVSDIHLHLTFYIVTLLHIIHVHHDDTIVIIHSQQMC